MDQSGMPDPADIFGTARRVWSTWPDLALYPMWHPASQCPLRLTVKYVFSRRQLAEQVLRGVIFGVFFVIVFFGQIQR